MAKSTLITAWFYLRKWASIEGLSSPRKRGSIEGLSSPRKRGSIEGLSSPRKRGSIEGLSSPRKRGSILLFNSTNDAEHRFIMCDATLTTSIGTLSDISLIAKGCDVILLLPAKDVVLTQLTMPTVSRSKQLKMLPFMLEESLILHPLDYHYCIAQGTKRAIWNVAYIEKKSLSFYLSACAQAGLKVVSAYPRMLAVPYAPDTWQLYVDNSEVLVRTGFSSGFSSTLENLECALKTFEEHPKIERQQFDSNLLCTQTFQKQPLNLLQGEFAVNAQHQKTYRLWTITGILGMMAVTVNLASLVFQDYKLSSMNQAVQTEIHEIYQKQFPQEEMALAPDVRLAKEIQVLKQHEGPFYFLLETAGNILKKAPDVVVKKMQFSDGTLKVEVNRLDKSLLEALRAAHLTVTQQDNTLFIKGDTI